MAAAEIDSLNLRAPAEVIAFAQSVLDPDPKKSSPGLRPTIKLHPSGHGANGPTEYEVSISGEGFGGPASTLVAVDPDKDNSLTTHTSFWYQYALMLREIQRRFSHAESEESVSTSA